MSEAREQAWMVHNDADAWAVRARQASFYAGWGAAKRDDQQRIAALIEAARDVVETGICVWCAEPMTAPYVSTRGETCPIHDLNAALRALAGQSEEAESA